MASGAQRSIRGHRHRSAFPPRLVGGWLLVCGLSLLACRGAPPALLGSPPADAPALRVATYNVNFGLSGDAATAAAIARLDADVVLLQETTEGWERTLRPLLSARYPDMRFWHARGAGGMGLLARVPVEAAELLPPEGQGWFPALRVVVQSDIGKAQLLSVHLRPPFSDRGGLVSGYFETPPVREAEMRRFLSALDPRLPSVVVGDFNEPLGRAAGSALEARGMRSVWEGGVPPTTWRWRTSAGTLRQSLDHVFYDARHFDVYAARVLDLGRSDHLPVLAVLGAAATIPRTTSPTARR